ncbi:MAG: hypothetical protein RIS26_224 [Actinomycetota bacterium]|jgi:membrane protease YdiL (CAAX protease family)
MTSKRRIDIEVSLVLGVSLGKSAVYSVLALLTALLSKPGLSGSQTTINQSASVVEFLDFSYQLVGMFFQWVPVALAAYLLGDLALTKLGISWIKLGRQLLTGLALAASIGVPGLGLYLGARALGLSAKVVPTDVNQYWWTVILLLLSAATAAALEEGIMIGYIFNRFRERGLSDRKILWISAVIRGSYHLYQGFGGFVGNLVMGLVFGQVYRRTGKLIPLLFAHFLLDAVIFVGYAWATTWLPLN